MLGNFKYRVRDSLIEKIDPRTRWIVSILLMAATLLFWDIRFIAFFFVLMILQTVLSRVSWKEIGKAWLWITLLIMLMIFLNVLLNPAGAEAAGKILWQAGGEGWPFTLRISTGMLWQAFCQFVRLFSVTGFFIIMPFTLDPRTYGATFKIFGQKVAFAMDLTFRYIPTLIRDFHTIADAQRARGYELEKVRGGLFARLRKITPIFIPLVVNSILAGEDVANAMELRGFGRQRRTWMMELKFKWFDVVLMVLAVLILSVSLVLVYGFQIGGSWMPGFLF